MTWEGTTRMKPNSKTGWTRLLFLVGMSTTPTLGATNDTLVMTASITKGTCSLSVSPSELIFSQPHVITAFQATDAVDVSTLQLNYDCSGFPNGTQPTVKLTGETAPGDARVFLSSQGSQDAKGSGFMLKQGEVMQLAGFYTAGTTLVADTSFGLPSNTQGTQLLSVGFVKQDNTVPVTAGQVKAAITFTYVTP